MTDVREGVEGDRSEISDRTCVNKRHADRLRRHGDRVRERRGKGDGHL